MKIYQRDEAVRNSTEYFGGDTLAAEVFINKYALRNDKLEIIEDTPDKMHHRLAKEFARIEAKYPNPMSEDEIYGLIKGYKEIVPQGSPMFGIGNPYQHISLSNCFVTKTVDSYGGICRADERIAQISKRRGGVGLDISAIRPKGMPTKNSALTTDGVAIFMSRFSNTSREVAQNGRRGALMITMSVHHPEILTFIMIKRDLQKVTGANISIRVTDEFMDAVKKNKLYEVRWPVDSEKPSISQKVKAKDIWEAIIESNYLSAEPGVLFWDNIIRNSPADIYAKLGFDTISTNPCGELPLCENDSCRLLVLNLFNFVNNPFSKETAFDEARFIDRVHRAQRLMDDLVDMELECVDKIIHKIEKDPEADVIKSNELSLWKEIREKCNNGRRTGLGVTALGDCIAALNIKYGSEQSIETVEKIYRTLRDEAYRESIIMAKERGSFPVFDAKLEKAAKHEYLERLPDDIKKSMWKQGRRNIALLTTAPAGSVSSQTQTTSGFEPVFMTEYVRKRKLQDSDKEDPDFIDAMGDKWKEYKVDHHGLQLFKKVTGKETKDSPYFGAEAAKIDFFTRVKMQAIATRYVDHAISSTINLPNNVSVDTISKLYISAWEEGCKGLTIYRDGSRDGVLTAKKSSTKTCEDCDEAGKIMVELINNGHRPTHIIPSSAPKRPETVICEIHRSKVGGSEWLLFVGTLNGQPYEVFGGEADEFTIPQKYKTGWIVKNGKVNGVTQYNLILGSLNDPNEKMEFKGIVKHFNNNEYGAFTRVISLSLRHGIPIKYICEQITKKGVEGDLFSFQRAMSRVLKKYIVEGEKCELECPECHSHNMVYKNGCPVCMECGNSHCA